MFPVRDGKEKFASWPVSRVLYGPGLTRNVAAIHLGRHLHAASRNPPGWRARKPAVNGLSPAPCHPYSVLLPVGFTLPPLLPEARWALTPPFHPYHAMHGGLLSVALSLGSPPPDVIRHRISVEPGLSSPYHLSTLVKRGCPANWLGLH